MSLLANRAFRVSGGIILAVAVVALAGPWLSPNDYLATNFDALLSRPAIAGAHFFGTDDVAIVRRPDSDPEIYKNIARRYAANLEDHLLIIHGMQDQVVPFKTTAVLAEELIKNGKDFDFAFAPGATHAWSREPYYQQFLFRKLLAHFDRYLMSAGLDPDSSDGPGE